MYVNANASGVSFTLTSRVDAAAGAQSITTTGTGWVDDTSHTDPLISTNEINWKAVAGAGAVTPWTFCAKMSSLCQIQGVRDIQSGPRFGTRLSGIFSGGRM